MKWLHFIILILSISCREVEIKDGSPNNHLTQTTFNCFEKGEILQLIKKIITDPNCKSCEKIVFVNPDAVLQAFYESEIEGNVAIRDKQLAVVKGQENVKGLPKIELVKKDCDHFVFHLVSREENYVVKGYAKKGKEWKVKVEDIIVIN